jgi:hypothetical protein
MDGGSAPKISKNGNKFPSAKQHRHQMAIRYIVKIFLIDLHVAWRQMEGLPLSQPYHVAKLGMRDHCQTGQENHRLSAYQHPLENNLQKVGQCFRANHSSAACQIPIENQSVKAVYDQGKGTNGAENLIKP